MPQEPGYSIEIFPASRERYAFPDGTYWAQEHNAR